jgi:hypothetical protein
MARRVVHLVVVVVVAAAAVVAARLEVETRLVAVPHLGVVPVHSVNLQILEHLVNLREPVRLGMLEVPLQPLVNPNRLEQLALVRITFHILSSALILVHLEQMDGVPPVTTGSSNPPFAVFSEKDSGPSGNGQMLNYQSISCIPAYRGTSFEVRLHLLTAKLTHLVYHNRR